MKLSASGGKSGPGRGAGRAVHRHLGPQRTDRDGDVIFLQPKRSIIIIERGVTRSLFDSMAHVWLSVFCQRLQRRKRSIQADEKERSSLRRHESGCQSQCQCLIFSFFFFFDPLLFFFHPRHPSCDLHSLLDSRCSHVTFAKSNSPALRPSPGDTSSSSSFLFLRASHRCTARVSL